jgi:hypothetical protein
MSMMLKPLYVPWYARSPQKARSVLTTPPMLGLSASPIGCRFLEISYEVTEAGLALAPSGTANARTRHMLAMRPRRASFMSPPPSRARGGPCHDSNPGSASFPDILEPTGY